MIETYFRQLGFSANEISVYLALAELGKSTASLLAKKVRIPRTTAYSVLDSLVSKGIVAQEQRGNTKFYAVNKVDSLLRITEQEKSELEVKEYAASQLVNLVKPFFSGKNYSIPSIKFYEGQENVESMLFDHAKEWQEQALQYDAVWWGYQDHTFVEHYREWLDYHWEIKTPKEEIRLISNRTPIEDELKGKVPGREIRQVADDVDFSSSIWVVGECIILFMTRQQPHYAFQMRDTVFADNLRAVFRLLWSLTNTAKA